MSRVLLSLTCSALAACAAATEAPVAQTETPVLDGGPAPTAAPPGPDPSSPESFDGRYAVTGTRVLASGCQREIAFPIRTFRIDAAAGTLDADDVELSARVTFEQDRVAAVGQGSVDPACPNSPVGFEWWLQRSAGVDQLGGIVTLRTFLAPACQAQCLCEFWITASRAP